MATPAAVDLDRAAPTASVGVVDGVCVALQRAVAALATSPSSASYVAVVAIASVAVAMRHLQVASALLASSVAAATSVTM